MQVLIADCETNSLLETMTVFHCIQIGDADGTDSIIYRDQDGYPSISEGIARLKAADKYVFHNGIGFDYWAINHFYPGTIERHKLIDSLVLARLKDPEQRSHSLQAWGERTGTIKGTYKGDYQTWDQEFHDYSVQDIHAGRAVWHAVKDVLEWGQSAQLEHDVAWAMNAQERNGWCFDEKAAQTLDAELRGEVGALNVELQATFPPLERKRMIVPKRDNKARGLKKGVESVAKTWMEPFNPSSRQHVAERLQMAGWKPKEFGADGTPTVDEKTLSAMSFPAAKLIVKYFRSNKKLGMLSDGTNGWLKMVRNGRIHGRVNPNGAATGRMTHSKPNVAQADTDPRMRALWVPKPGWKLVGADAEGLEARMLAHYLTPYDGGSFTEKLIHGKSEDATDVHSANRDAVRRVGFEIDRTGAKTLLYAMMYGAGGWKLGTTVIENLREQGLKVPKVPAKEVGIIAAAALAKSMKGIDRLAVKIRTTAKERGYLTGLDGRRLSIRSEHSALNTLLQGAGAIVMKKAIQRLFETEGHRHGIDWAIVGTIHDEVQTEVRPELAEHLGETIADCIRLAGLDLNIRCPLAGKPAVGTSWAETH